MEDNWFWSPLLDKTFRSTLAFVDVCPFLLLMLIVMICDILVCKWVRRMDHSFWDFLLFFGVALGELVLESEFSLEASDSVKFLIIDLSIVCDNDWREVRNERKIFERRSISSRPSSGTFSLLSSLSYFFITHMNVITPTAIHPTNATSTKFPSFSFQNSTWRL